MYERLQKVIAQAGISSRRQAEEMITEGKVKVNGKIVTELGSKVDPDKDKIIVAGKPLQGREKKIYLLLNKPAGYVTTVSDPQGRPKVVDLLRGVKERVYPVGRLDYATEGLLLLTNDGELAYALTHPKHGVKKIYLAEVSGVPTADKLQELRRGVPLSDGMTAPASVRLVGSKGDRARLQLEIHEGRNRQVRRMCDYIGHPVIKLQRTGLGKLTLTGIPLGKYRRLTPAEVKELYDAVQL